MNKSYGYIESPKDLRDYRLSDVCKSVNLPDSFEVQHGHIKDQGCVNSCVAHAISSVLESNDGNNYSTGFIYGYRPDNYYQGEGMIPLEALKTLYNVGSLLNDELNVNVEMSKAKEIVDKDLINYVNKAYVRRISSYARLNTINDIKNAIYTSKSPVILSIKTGENGLQIDSNNIALIPKDFETGGHCMLCYGWNEIGLLIQNSWGEEWGENGTFILPYSYPIKESWLISLNKNNVIKKPKYYWLRELIMKIIKFFTT